MNTMNSLMSIQGAGLLMTLIIGGLAGFIAEKLTKSTHGLLTNIVLGIAGAMFMNFLLGFLHISFFIGGRFLTNLVTATAGAVALIVIWRMIKGR